MIELLFSLSFSILTSPVSDIRGETERCWILFLLIKRGGETGADEATPANSGGGNTFSLSSFLSFLSLLRSLFHLPGFSHVVDSGKTPGQGEAAAGQEGKIPGETKGSAGKTGKEAGTPSA